jgi:serine/threonine-protein kinase
MADDEAPGDELTYRRAGPPPRARSAVDVWRGRVLQDRFVILRHLASGGMGSVFVGQDRQFDTEVAIKVLKIPDGFDRVEELERRFEAEAKVVAHLRDPRILRPIAWGRADEGELFMVSELLKGAPLQEELERVGRLTERRTVLLLVDTCRALSEAHAAGVVHRDLKPGNLFLQRSRSGDETCRVLDFGIAKVTQESTFYSQFAEGLTEPGSILGTVAYMSPEQVDGRPVDSRSDLDSLGAVAYHCLTGAPPFSGATASVLYAHMNRHPPPLREAVPHLQVDPRLEQLISELLAKDPSHRPPTADAVKVRLQTILGQVSSDLATMPDAPAASPAPTVEAPGRPRPPGVALVALGILLMAVGGGVWRWASSAPVVTPLEGGPGVASQGAGDPESRLAEVRPPEGASDVESKPDPRPARTDGEGEEEGEAERSDGPPTEAGAGRTRTEGSPADAPRRVPPAPVRQRPQYRARVTAVSGFGPDSDRARSTLLRAVESCAARTRTATELTMTVMPYGTKDLDVADTTDGAQRFRTCVAARAEPIEFSPEGLGVMTIRVSKPGR